MSGCRNCGLSLSSQDWDLCSPCHGMQELTSDLACAIERGEQTGRFSCEVRDIFDFRVRLENGECYSIQIRREDSL